MFEIFYELLSTFFAVRASINYQQCGATAVLKLDTK